MRRALGLFLMICINVIPVLPASVDADQSGIDAPKLSAKELKRQTEFREKVERMGLGAEIRVEMRGGSNPVIYEGTIDEIAAENFSLNMKGQMQPIQYHQVQTVTLKAREYKTLGQPDPVRARRIAVDMGIGQKVKVKLVSNELLTGTIQFIEKENFVVSSNGKPVTVAYGDVREIKKKKFPAWAKGAIAAGIAAGALGGLMYAACGGEGCH